MAIGDFLLPGEQVFTPQMRAAGVRLIPSASTPPISGLKQGGGAARAIGTALTGGAQGGTVGPSQAGGGGKSIIESVPPDLSFSAGDLLRLEPRGTQPSPFGPPVPRELPEDDFLTPESMLSPSQIEAKGGFFTGLGKALSTPGAAKFLIGLGAQIDPRGLSPLGEIGLKAADAEAERQFSEMLDIVGPGTPQSQIQIPGLTAESRSRILAEREGRKARATEEEREAQLFPRQLDVLDQDIATGRIQAEEAKLKLDTIKRSMFESLTGGGAKSAQELIRLGAKAIGIPLADDLELPSDLTRDEAMDILTQAATTFRTRLNLAGRSEQRTILTGAARDARLNTLSSRYRRMLEVLETAETAGLNEFAQAQIIKVEDEILKLGGEIPTGQGAAEALPALDPQQSFNQMLQQLREGGAADQAAAPSDQPSQSAEVQKMLKDLRKKGFVPEDFPTTQDIINAHQALVKK